MEALSTFYFPPYLSSLPDYPQHWTSPGKGQENRQPHTGKGPVLVVEDDPAILSSVADILEFEGYAVETATNGAEGLDILDRVHPTLILLDMRMPVLNGWDFARIIKERDISVPILVMTAAQDARRWAHEIGADGYIAKPFHILDLIASVDRFHPPAPQD
jgi:DNA-binding response OmpR family regulator